MILKTVQLFVLLMLTAIGICQQSDSDAIKVFYLGGQSNMDGYGFVSELPEGWTVPISDLPDLHLVQFDQATPAGTMEMLRSAGLEPVHDYVPVEQGNGPLIAQMADPAIRIVALTVTEGGYYINPATKNFDADHPDIQHDAQNPAYPPTRLRGNGGGAQAAARPGYRTLYRPMLRQFARQRQGFASHCGVTGADVGPGFG